MTPAYNISSRKKARQKVLQILYSQSVNHRDLEQIMLEFSQDPKRLNKTDKDYFRQLLYGVHNNREQIDLLIAEVADRPITSIDIIEYGILSIGTYELLYCPDLSLKIVINEAINLSKLYSSDQSYQYINGVLDQLASKLKKSQTKITDH